MTSDKGSKENEMLDEVKREILGEILRWLEHYDRSLTVSLPWHLLEKHNFDADAAVHAHKEDQAKKEKEFLANKKKRLKALSAGTDK